MDRRLRLQELLTDILGSQNVYYQAPSNLQMKYPCFVYSLDDERVTNANNKPYNRRRRYSVKYISRTPDDERLERLANQPLCSFDRFYTADNLNHYVYDLFF